MSKLIVAALIAAAGTAAVAQQEGGKVEVADPEAARIVADCSARKFETAVEIQQGTEKRLTRMKLCAVANSDDAAWLKTLNDAKAKIMAHPDISAESKANIGRQLDVEIAKYASAAAAPTMEPAPVAQQPSLPAPSMAVASTMATSAAKPAAKAPRLTIRCLAPGESGPGSSCSALNRATRLQIRADADLTGGASLRFLRRGDARGEIALAQMRAGDLIRSKLPPELCAGVASSKVEIQVIGGTQVVDTLGPYSLRC